MLFFYRRLSNAFTSIEFIDDFESNTKTTNKVIKKKATVFWLGIIFKKKQITKQVKFDFLFYCSGKQRINLDQKWLFAQIENNIFWHSG